MKGLLSAIMVSLPMFVGIAHGASVVNQQIVKQVNTVLEKVGEETNATLSLSGGHLERVYFSICQSEESGYGVLVGAPKAQCITFNQDFEQLEVPEKYEVVDVEQDFPKVTKAFLAHQPNVNHGFWQQESKGVCYVSNKNHTFQSHPICLREIAPITSSETEPTVSGQSGSDDVGGYIFISVAAFVVIAVLTALGFYSGCIQCVLYRCCT